MINWLFDQDKLINGQAKNQQGFGVINKESQENIKKILYGLF